MSLEAPDFATRCQLPDAHRLDPCPRSHSRCPWPAAARPERMPRLTRTWNPYGLASCFMECLTSRPDATCQSRISWSTPAARNRPSGDRSMEDDRRDRIRVRGAHACAPGSAIRRIGRPVAASKSQIVPPSVAISEAESGVNRAENRTNTVLACSPRSWRSPGPRRCPRSFPRTVASLLSGEIARPPMGRLGESLIGCLSSRPVDRSLRRTMPSIFEESKNRPSREITSSESHSWKPVDDVQLGSVASIPSPDRAVVFPRQDRPLGRRDDQAGGPRSMRDPGEDLIARRDVPDPDHLTHSRPMPTSCRPARRIGR